MPFVPDISAGYWCFRNQATPPSTTAETLEALSGVPRLRGVEFHVPYELDQTNAEEVLEEMGRLKLEVALLGPALVQDDRFGRGALAHPDPKIRAAAVERIQQAIDLAAQIRKSGHGTPLVVLWAGRDGFDYAFQSDHEKSWSWLVDGVQACLDHRKDVRLAIEYKPYDPRAHTYLGTVGSTLSFVNEVGSPRLGVNLDIGKAVMVKENPAASAVLLARHKRLFHVHLNDGWKSTPDDLIVASTNLVEQVEFFYWLRRIGYKGWYGLDVVPRNEDTVEALTQSVANIEAIHRVLDRVKDAEWNAVFGRQDGSVAARLVRRMLLEPAR